MKNFNFHQSTIIKFGCGTISELPEITSGYGKKALLVTTSMATSALAGMYRKVIKNLNDAGVDVAHYDGVIPNPTVESITRGAIMAREFGVEVVIGLGGGSAMDSAKAISVEATHEGTSWDYLFYKSPQPDPKNILPVIAVSTTSGTGSQVTQVAVITNTQERDKSALYNNILYPRVCIIDPELMVTLPQFVTACTGFDVFCHTFESAIHPGRGAYSELMAWEAIAIVVENLPKVLANSGDIGAREKMAWADTLAGLCIANAGVTLPHGMGMAIGGMYPHVAHGEALAIVYPAFTKFTFASAVPEFSRMAKIIDPTLNELSDDIAAAKSTEVIEAFLSKIGRSGRAHIINMPEAEIEALTKQCMVLPDYKNNPRIPTFGELKKLVTESCIV